MIIDQELEKLILCLQSRDEELAEQVVRIGNDPSAGRIRATEAGLKVVFLRQSDISDETYDAMRPTEWSLEAWPGTGRWDNQFYVHIFTKDFATISSGTVFHLTPAANIPSIVANGLVIGRKVGTHTTNWAESKHYIHVSETKEQRQFWRDEIEPAYERVEFRIRLRESGLNVYHDVRSRGQGYIVDAIRVARNFLEGPIPLSFR